MTGTGKQMSGFQNRRSSKDSLDDFPTPKWATRAFIEHCLPGVPDDLKDMTVWEPCANRGYMVDVLGEYFGRVFGSDIADYGAGFPVVDFLLMGDPASSFGVDIDYIITNPPFVKAEEFVHHWHEKMQSVHSLCLLLRSSWMEGVSRYDTIFSGAKRPKWICPYVRRVPMVEGRLDKDVGTQMPYAWFVWDREQSKYSPTRVAWNPGSRDEFEKEGDWPDADARTDNP